ncbi:hypothetical protein Bca4012_102877 [Brassica carinata]
MSRSAAVAAKPRSASRRATSVQILVVVANIQMRTLKAKRKACPPWKRLSGRVSGWKSTAASRGVGAFRPLKIRRTECAHAGRTHNASGLQVRTRRLLAGCLSASVASGPPRVGGGGLGAALRELSRASNSQLRTEMRTRGIRLETTAKRAGLAESAGKEDPVELDSSPTFANRTVAWPIDPLDLEFEARGVRKVTTGITGLIHQVLDCSPTNRERELGLDRRETESGLEAAHRPPPDCRPSVGAGSQRRVSLANVGQLSKDSPREGPAMLICVLTDSPRGQKSPKQSTLTFHQYTVVYWRTVLVAKITEQSTGRASVPICVLMYCPRGEKHRTVHGKGERAVMRAGGQSSWRKSPADSPRGENHPRTFFVAKITADSPREGPAC